MASNRRLRLCAGLLGGATNGSNSAVRSFTRGELEPNSCEFRVFSSTERGMKTLRQVKEAVNPHGGMCQFLTLAD